MKKQWKKRKILVLCMVFAVMMFAGCTEKKDTVTSKIEEGMSDVEYVQSKGTLLVGVTDFAPMDYQNGEEWTGFDANLAENFAKSIGVTVEFVEIDWDKKIELLEDGSIDCIWNAMTMTEELQETIACSKPYLSNAQVVVLRDDEMEQYSTEESCQHLLFAVEEGSTGEMILKDRKYRFTSYPTQMEALESVREKKADAAVIDIIMAEYYTGDGQKFNDLGFDITFNDEKICTGFRKNSDLVERVNEFFETSYEDGTIDSLAKQYEIGNAVLE